MTWQPSPAYQKTIHAIDSFTAWTGKAIAWLIVPLVLGVTWEVIARYALNDPTIWAYDLTYMLYGSMFMLGTAYALLRGAHIRTDMLWDRWSDRRKGMVDAIAFVAFFFPAMVMVLLSSVDDAWYAFQIGERSEQTAWRPLIWPFKATVPLAAFLLIVQGVSELLKNIYAIRTGRLWAKREEIQI